MTECLNYPSQKIDQTSKNQIIPAISSGIINDQAQDNKGEQHSDEPSKASMSKNCKIWIIFIVIFVMVAIAVPLALEFKNPQIKKIGESSYTLGDGSKVGVEVVSYFQRNLVGEDDNFNLTIRKFSKLNTNGNSSNRLLEEQVFQIVIDYMDEKSGIAFKWLNTNEAPLMEVDVDTLLQFIDSTVSDEELLADQGLRLTQAEQPNYGYISKDNIDAAVIYLLKQSYIDLFGVSANDITIQALATVSAVKDQNSQNYILVTNDSQLPNSSRRRLEELYNNKASRLLLGNILRRVTRPIERTVKKVTAETVRVIKRDGPLVGTVAGFAVAGPVGAQIGNKIGKIAQVAALACVQGVRIRCTGKGVAQASNVLIDSAKSLVIDGLTKTKTKVGTNQMTKQIIVNTAAPIALNTEIFRISNSQFNYNST